MKLFIETVRAEMKKQGISISKLCKDNNISRTAFQNWEKGSQPTLGKALRIMEYLGVARDDVLGFSSTTKPQKVKIKVYNGMGEDVTKRREWFIDKDGDLLFKLPDIINSPLYVSEVFHYEILVDGKVVFTSEGKELN